MQRAAVPQKGSAFRDPELRAGGVDIWPLLRCTRETWGKGLWAKGAARPEGCWTSPFSCLPDNCVWKTTISHLYSKQKRHEVKENKQKTQPHIQVFSIKYIYQIILVTRRSAWPVLCSLERVADIL